ncbi:MAG: peptidyl-prolyl cis-trans isomerase [Holosporales bacterium]|jgi:hypothetical protein|nr:peptidyl-prolyl cis-trans isomerase [Holosporales bacterium]
MNDLKRFVTAVSVVTLLGCSSYGSTGGKKFEKSAKQLKWEEEQAAKRAEAAKKSEQPKSATPLSRVVVEFKDGSVIVEDDINEAIREIPEEVTNRMTMGQLKLFVTILLISRRVAELETARMQLDEDDKKKIERRLDSIKSAMLLRRLVDARMTNDALREHYDKTFNSIFKNKKAADVIVIMVRNKADIAKLRLAAKSETSLTKYLAENPSITSTALTNRLLDTFPPEVAKATSDGGTKNLIGPFPVRNVLMFFYVTKSYNAKKEPFTDAMIPQYKKTAYNDFMKEVLRELYKIHKVKVYDCEKQEVNPFDIGSKTKGSDSAIAKLKDGDVLARWDSGTVTVKDVKSFFAISSLTSELLVAMAQRFKMPLRAVIIYAVKMVVDEMIAKQEIRIRGFDNEPEVMKIIARETNDEKFHIFMGKKVKVSESEITDIYRRIMSTMDKDDHEVSAKLVLYGTKEEAESILRSVLSGDKKFATLYQSATKENRMELRNATKRSVSPTLWGALKGTAAAACHRTVVEIETNSGEIRWAVLFVANRRVIPLPTLNDPNVKQQCTKIAFENKVVLEVKGMTEEKVHTISGRPVREMLDNPAALEIIKYIISTPKL